VPDVFGALDQRYSPKLRIAADTAIEAQRHTGGMLGKYRKVHPRIVASGAERIRHARQSCKCGFRHFESDTNGKPQG
jgi:hypothetical protein